MPKDSVLVVIAGLAGAALFFPALAGGAAGAMVSFASALPLIMAGLGLGFRSALYAAAVGTVALAALGAAVAMAFLLVDVLPSLLLVGLGLRRGPGGDGEWYPIGKIAAALSLVAAMVLASILVGTPPHAGGIEGGVLEAVRHAVDAWAPVLSQEERQEIAKALAPILPWQMMKSWALRVLILGVVAQWAVTRMRRDLRPTPGYMALELPSWSVVTFLLVLGVAVTGPGDVGYLARNAGFVLGLPLFLLGLAAVHAQAGRGRSPRTVLMAFYVGYVVATWSYVAVIVLGLVEHWVRLRQRRLGGGSGRDGDGSRSA